MDTYIVGQEMAGRTTIREHPLAGDSTRATKCISISSALQVPPTHRIEDMVEVLVLAAFVLVAVVLVREPLHVGRSATDSMEY